MPLRRLRLVALVAFAIVSTVAALTTALAEPPAVSSQTPPSAEAPKYFVDVRLDTPDTLRELARAQFDVAGVNHDQGVAGVVGTEVDLARLRELGYVYSIREVITGGLAAQEVLGQYTDPLEMTSFVNYVTGTYPNLAQKVMLKDTLFEGQKQYAVHITKDVIQPNLRPRFIVDAQIHAREVMPAEIALDMMDQLTWKYASDPAIRRFVDNVDIWIIPIVNPDGAQYMFNSDSGWRKNRHPGCAVDNNRNFPTMWGSCNGSSGDCGSDIFRGTAPASEPETQGVANLTRDLRPFYALSYHSYGEYILYPYGCGDPDEMAAIDAIAQELNNRLQRDSGQTGGWRTGPSHSTIYEVDGASIDDQYNRYGAIGFVIEVNTGGFQPDYDSMRDVTVQRQRTAWKFFLEKILDGPQVRGRVTDAETGQGLPARVALAEVTYTHGEAPRMADSRGIYNLLVRAGQPYTLTVSHPGYCTVTHAFTAGTGPVTHDVVLGHPSAPQGVAAAGAGDNRIDVSWQAVTGATEYRVFRALAPGGPWAPAGTAGGGATTFSDLGVSGGVTWHYVVRSYMGCESPDSNVASASTTGPCTLAPSFPGASSATDARSSTCAIGVDWPAATQHCAGPVTYRVYRSTTAPFTPSAANMVAAGLAGTHYDDHAALQSGSAHFYIVRAVDGSSGAEDANTWTVFATPTGPWVPGTWSDDAGDSGSATLVPSAPWSVQTTGGKTGPRVYATGSYGTNTCAPLTTPVIELGAGPVLNFASKYDLETNYDAGIVEIATGPSFSTWTKVSNVNYPDGLSNGGNACGFPTSGAGTVFSRTQATPSYPGSDYTGSLAAYANQPVKLRFRVGSDGGTVGQGWWIDDVRVTGALVPGTCASGAVPTPREVSAGTPLTCVASGTSISVNYEPACGALDTAAFIGSGPIAGAPSWTAAACGLGTSGRASFDPGTVPPGGLSYFVLVGQRGGVEGSYGHASSGDERPEAVGVGACDAPRDLGGVCP